MELETRVLELATRRGLTQEPHGRDLSPELVALLRRELEQSAPDRPIAAPDSWVAESRLEEEGAEAAPPAPPQLARYRIETLLGAGASGLVYRAQDLQLQRQVALKLPRRLGATRAERWLREARAQARISHPGVCRVFEVGEDGGHPFIAMELVEGSTATTYAGHLSVGAAAALLRDVAEAVHAAHRVGLLHLDLKPGNLLVEPTETGLRSVVADFGLHLDPSAPQDLPPPKGTPPFASPEQMMGGAVDRRSDIYALGMTLTVLLAGRLPHPGEAPGSGQPDDLGAVIRKALSPDLEDRYDSAQALADDLQRFLDGRPVRARAWTWPYRLRTWAHRHRPLVRGLVASALLLAGVSAFSAWSMMRTRRQALQAQRLVQWSEDLEIRLARARSAPLHDLRPDLSRIDRELAAMAQERTSLGSEARAAADFALGRVLWALGREEAAQRAFQTAWDGGYRTPSCALSLGLALEEAYFRSMRNAYGQPDPGRKEAARHRAAEGLKAPALELLAKARDPEVPQAFVEASLALIEGRLDEAIAKGEAVSQAQPWDTRALALRAEAWMQLAERRLAERQAPEAVDACWDKAQALLQDAVEVDRSDPQVCLKLVLHFIRRHPSDIARADAQIPWARTMQSVLERGLQAQPGHAGLLAMRAYLQMQKAYDLITRSGDPLDALEASKEASAQALRADPKDFRALSVRGGALTLEATFRSRRGEEVEALLREAESLDDRALAEVPDDPFPHIGLATVCDQLAALQRDRGEDPHPALERALREAGVACELIPSQTWRRGALAVFAGELVDADLDQGLDPSAHLAQARAAIEQTHGAADRIPAFWSNRAQLERQTARWRLRQGQAAASAFQEAHRCLAQAEALNPKYPGLLMETAELALAEAECAKADPAAMVRHLGVAVKACDRLAAAQPGDLNPLLALGKVAHRAATAGLDSPWIARGTRALETLLVRSPRQEEARALLGLIYARTGRPGGEALLRQALQAQPHLTRRYGATS